MEPATIALWAWSQVVTPPAVAPEDSDAAGRATVTSPPSDPARPPVSVVVIVDDSVDGAELAGGIDAHLHGEATVTFVHEPREPDDPRARVDLAIAYADEASADAALWVARRPGDVTEVYLVRAGKRAMWMRPLPTEPGAAGREAVGIVVRSAVAALAEGSETGMTAVDIDPPPPEDEPPPPDAEPPPPEITITPARTRGRALLSLAYAGSSYATDPRWFSGGIVSAGWAWPVGVRVEAGYTALPGLEVRLPDGTLQLRRHPVHAEVGYDHRWGNVRVGGGMAFVLDWTVRRATAQPGASAMGDRGRAAFALAAMGRAAVIAVWRLEVFTSVGLQAWIAQPRYAVAVPGDAPQLVLRPQRLRAVVLAGLALRI